MTVEVQFRLREALIAHDSPQQRLPLGEDGDHAVMNIFNLGGRHSGQRIKSARQLGKAFNPSAFFRNVCFELRCPLRF
ncbi:hypothetical protein GW16_14810 [Xanthomonas arboricola pv. celebensis]|nr:hypothetical protein GW16_14810 [Xanthomonas arboricola pv. celebensis]